MVGGAAGSYLGSQRFSPVLIKRLLAAVLIIAGLKLVGLELPGRAVIRPNKMRTAIQINMGDSAETG
jgi:hypothetical protein